MLRLIKYNKTFKRYLDLMQVNPGIMRISKSLLAVFFLIHLMSCIWFLVSKFDDHMPDSWVARNDLVDADPNYQYLVSAYWALQTITTVGFGDITASTRTEMILSLLWMIFGVGFYSFTVGNLSSLIASMDTKTL